MDTLTLDPTAADLRDEVVLDADVDSWMADMLGGLTGDDAGMDEFEIEDDEDF